MKPPKILYVNPSGTSTDAGRGFIGFPSKDDAVRDIVLDRNMGLNTQEALWIYELKTIEKIVISAKRKP